MILESEFNIGDKVYFLYDNKVVCHTIAGIKFPIVKKPPNTITNISSFKYFFYKGKINNENYILQYYVGMSGYKNLEIEGKELYSTKEKLLKSL